MGFFLYRIADDKGVRDGACWQCPAGSACASLRPAWLREAGCAANDRTSVASLRHASHRRRFAARAQNRATGTEGADRYFSHWVIGVYHRQTAHPRRSARVRRSTP
jgi:hypothetical protein